MRKLFVLLSFTLILTSCGDKEPKKEIVPEKKVEEVKTPIVKKETAKPILVFTVQIRASKNKLKKYSSVDNVQIFNENNMYKYRLGSFKTYQEAKSYRRTLLQKFPGAFVQAVKNNQPISIQEALK
jgi:hypothetical protein